MAVDIAVEMAEEKDSLSLSGSKRPLQTLSVEPGVQQRNTEPDVQRRKANKKITKNHPQFELAYDMMLGIRHTVNQVEAIPPRALVGEDYKTVTRLHFPHKGSPTTPPHEMRAFKFKDYCPEVFRQIREASGIDAVDYLATLCGKFSLLEFISNAKSGAFFFFSYNRRFMIKSISNAETKFLKGMLENYYVHRMSNPNTLLSSFYGLHRVKPHKRKKMHFLIMGSAFYTRRIMHLTYDLKGSTHGRKATAEQKKKETCVYKDKDYVQMGTQIRIGPERAKLLNEQIQKDTQFLQNLDIMDYSLLLGVHDTNRPGPLVRENTVTISVNRSRSTPVRIHEADADADDELRERLPSVVSHGVPRHYSQVESPSDFDFHARKFGSVDDIEMKLAQTPSRASRKPSVREAEEDEDEKRPVFHNDDGGMRGEDEHGMSNGHVYYIGIIDILIKYSLKKRAESRLKRLRYSVASLSAVSPSMYCKRFREFMARSIN